MAENLEETLNDSSVYVEDVPRDITYNLTDLIIPTKGLRHIPEIIKMKSSREKCYEIGVNTWILTSQALIYCTLFF
jgi:hypothetical protein